MKTTYIYGIRCLEIGKYIYVGKSNAPRRRYSRVTHSHNDCVRSLAEEKGEGNFRIEELEEVKFKTMGDWVEREKFWVRKLRREGHPLCNKNDGGQGIGKHDEEARAKLRKARLGTHLSEETIAKISKALSGENNPMYGKTGEDHPAFGYRHTEEAKVNIGKNNVRFWLGKKNLGQSERMSGKNNFWYGKKRPEQSKRVSGDGNPMYGSHRSGKDNPMFGKHHAEEAKAAVGRGNAKSYPAFYNTKTGGFIPAGRNLSRLSRERGISLIVLENLKLGTTKQAKDGWKLATKGERVRIVPLL